MKDDLYVLDYPSISTFAEIVPKETKFDHSICVHCPCCGKRVSGSFWVQPREIVLTKRKLPDFLYNYVDYVRVHLSEVAIKKILESDLRGIIKVDEIDSVRFQRKSKEVVIPPKYYRIEVARSRITIDHASSDIKYGKMGDYGYCPLCRQVPATYNIIRKLELNMEQYEGYDIFQIYEMGTRVFLSQRFIDFCEDNKLTNLFYTKLPNLMK